MSFLQILLATCGYIALNNFERAEGRVSDLQTESIMRCISRSLKTWALFCFLILSFSTSQLVLAQSETIISPTNGKEGDSFGKVSISSDYAIVGSPYEDSKGLDAGAAYIFKRNGSAWEEQAVLTASNGGADDWFGNRLASFADFVESQKVILMK